MDKSVNVDFYWCTLLHVFGEDATGRLKETSLSYSAVRQHIQDA